MAKFMRLEMSGQLGRMLREIPVLVVESTKTDSIYLGKGSLVAGHERPDVTIQVFLKGGKVLISIRSRQAMMDLTFPFGTEEEQTAFPKMAKRAILDGMN